MKSLHNRVNIVPVIAKADTLTKAEINRLKKRVLEEIAKNSIKIYQLPEVEEDEEEDYKEQTRVLKVKISENRLSSKYWISSLQAIGSLKNSQKFQYLYFWIANAALD